MMDNLVLYIAGGFATVIGGFKAIDWLISLKYKTKDECESCRTVINETANTDRKLLIRVDTKMDLMLKHLKIDTDTEER